MFRFILIFFFFCFSSGSHAQGKNGLIDSLINKNIFPILPGYNPAGLPELDISKLDEVYTYNFGNQDSGKVTRYLVKPLNTHLFRTTNQASSFEDCNFCTINPDSMVLLPPVHVAYFYARTFRRKSEKYRHINFFVDHFIKNYGDTAWRLSDYHINMKLFEGNRLVKFWTFGPSYPVKNREGWVFTGQNQFDTVLKIEGWNHFSPNLYKYSFEVLDDEMNPYGYYGERIGFRDVRLENGKVLVNNAPLAFKTVALDPKALAIESSVSDYLRIIKVNNFNSILLKGRGTKEIFYFCDSAGLNVVQEINDHTFNSLSGLLQYFICFKEHPSLIAWSNAGLNSSWAKILKRLDEGRPLLNDRQANPAIQNWDQLDSAARIKIKNRFQTFRFYFLSDSSHLKIQLDENFPCLDIIALKWVIRENGTVVDQGHVENISWLRNAAEIRLDTRAGKNRSSLPSFEFQLVVDEDHFPYQKDDIIALGKFSYFIKEGNVIYQTDY